MSGAPNINGASYYVSLPAFNSNPLAARGTWIEILCNQLIGKTIVSAHETSQSVKPATRIPKVPNGDRVSYLGRA